MEKKEHKAKGNDGGVCNSSGKRKQGEQWQNASKKTFRVGGTALLSKGLWLHIANWLPHQMSPRELGCS